MKKLWLLTACCSMLMAEKSPQLEAKITVDKVEILDHLEQEIIRASKPHKEASFDQLIVKASSIPNMGEPSAVLTLAKEVQLSSSEPTITAPNTQHSYASKELSERMTIQPVEINSEEDIAAIVKEEEAAKEIKSAGITIDLGQVFAGSPTIYSLLFILSIASLGIWIYSLLSLRNAELFPSHPLETLKEQIQSHNYDSALEICQNTPSLLFGMVGVALKNRYQGQATILELMRAEGRRMSVAYWQKIGLLNEIAIIAPMIGLLGTVLGLFYAFYDLNRSAESISAIFDGLGISVGTTLGGLIVAIVALMFHAMTKYRLMRQLAHVESQAQLLAQVIVTPTQRQL